MKKILSHKIRIYPNNKVISYFAMCFGTARFAYNWGLDLCKKSLGENAKVPSGYELSKQLNAIKKSQYPWMYDVSKWVVQKAVYNLSEAFQRFFRKTSRFPKFKKKWKCMDSFYIGLGKFQVDENHIRLPKVGWVRMSHPFRFPGKPLSVTISRSNNKFYASIQVEVDDDYIYPHACKSQASVGVDLGVKYLAVLSTGEKFPNPRVLRFYEQKLRRIQKALSRKKNGSKNRIKAIGLLAKCHEKIRNIRGSNLHNLTSGLVENFRFIGIEDLNVSGMLKNHKLAKSIADASFFEIKRQIEYKAKLSGSDVVEIDRFYPSSKTCSICGWKKEDLKLSDREWRCEGCGMVHDRDINAARNILKVAQRHWETVSHATRGTINACGAPKGALRQEGGRSC